MNMTVELGMRNYFAPMISMVVSILVATLIIWPNAASAQIELQPAPFVEIKPGFKAVWEQVGGDGRGTAVSGLTHKYKYHWTFEGKSRSAYYYCLLCNANGAKFDFDKYLEFWPLEVGKRVKLDATLFVQARSQDLSYRITMTVAGTERRKMPFGEIDTYVIESKVDGIDNQFRRRAKIWYAPSLGAVVEFEDSASNRKAFNWRMVSFDESTVGFTVR
ncbi:MAG: hypothetical protein GKS02_13320 [Alphaproteobacteria bacterium]|nr:hypothetical protein [Alphaproteobacteria bacterium]